MISSWVKSRNRLLGARPPKSWRNCLSDMTVLARSSAWILDGNDDDLCTIETIMYISKIMYLIVSLNALKCHLYPYNTTIIRREFACSEWGETAKRPGTGW